MRLTHTSRENTMGNPRAVWIDTTSGTWGEVASSNGNLVIVLADDEDLERLESMSDSEIADFGNSNAVVAWELIGEYATLTLPIESLE